MSNIYDVNVLGYSVNVELISYTPGAPEIKSGHPDNWLPAEPMEIEWRVTDDNEEVLRTFIEDGEDIEHITDIEEIYNEEIESALIETIEADASGENDDGEY